MPSFFRTLSSRFRRSPRDESDSKRQDPVRIDTRRQASCKVLLLDGTDLNVVVPKTALASEVYEQVFYSLDLEERDYFGLQFTDHYHVQVGFFAVLSIHSRSSHWKLLRIVT
ncbi:FERM protein [Ancylostoma caninum]|uniref:FERM protein n=1 Tax=Ancylostoma caninum TaxID=29170 RepID=A0A368GXZ0_ANCCA|nr:FERM protein [Ancylostoma caninum]